MTEITLRQELKKNEIRSIYLLFGQENFSLRHSLSLLEKSVCPDNDPFGRADFEGNASIQEVYDAALSMPFMCERKLVVWCDCPITKYDDSDYKKLISLVEEIPDTTILVFLFETLEIDTKKLPDKFKKLQKAVEAAGGAVIEFCHRSDAEINKMLSDGASKRGCTLQLPVASYMREMCGNDLNMLINELDKLCSYAHGQNITREIIDKICTKNIDVSIYDLSKRLLSLDMKGVYGIIDELLYMKTAVPYIIVTLSSAFIDIFRAKAIREQGENITDHLGDFGYYEKISFRLKNAARDGQRMSVDAIGSILSELRAADERIKTTRCDERVELELLVSKIGLIIEKSR